MLLIVSHSRRYEKTARNTSPVSQYQIPKHAAPVGNCGDTVHLVPLKLTPGASYNYHNFDLGTWGPVSACPSATGRNTARLQCDGTYVQDCSFLHVYQSFRVDQPH